MHCKGHNRDGSKVAEGNQLADCQARKAALYETPSLQMLLGIPDHLTCLLRNLYAGQEATVRTGHGKRLVQNWERSMSRLYIVTLLI